MTAAPFVGPDFRREYGRLVAMLSRRAGLRHLDLVEDAAQSALLAAVESWPRTGAPDNPSAWLFRVASNHLIGELRQRARREHVVARHLVDLICEPPDGPSTLLAGDVRDDVLRLMFACCDETVPLESSLVMALKTLSGFGVREIAERLFITEANVYKRLARARDRLRELPFEPDELTGAEMAAGLPAVRAVLYLLFTEGHLSSHAQEAIRRELCEEAARLTEVLAEHPVGATAETFALLALMHLHLARISARRDPDGGLLLLEEQDRSQCDPRWVRSGLSWLARSAEGVVFSRYHAEAGIAAEHALAPSFAETRWERVADCYVLLERLAPSPLHTLNRALAVAECRGPDAGLAVLAGLAPPTWLAGSYLWAAALADLHRRAGNDELARQHRATALAGAPSSPIRALLERRLAHRPPRSGGG